MRFFKRNCNSISGAGLVNNSHRALFSAVVRRRDPIAMRNI
jgi:hypothetical protein